MTFEQALSALKEGKKATRAGWNGKDSWIAIQVPDQHSKMSTPYIYKKTAQGKFVPWVASHESILSEDWFVIA